MNEIKKTCKNEIITYSKIENERVIKRQYTLDGALKKEKTLDLSDLYCNRYFADIKSYFMYRINHDGYEEKEIHCCYGGECDKIDRDGYPDCLNCSVAASYNSMTYQE